MASVLTGRSALHEGVVVCVADAVPIDDAMPAWARCSLKQIDVY
jgi:hypothetical protein